MGSTSSEGYRVVFRGGARAPAPFSRSLILALLVIGGVETNPGPPKNVKVLRKGVSKDDQVMILEAHNRLRHRVAKGQETQGRPGPQPPAADMRKLFYDKELARKAQKWTDECTFEHDEDEKRQVARFKVGQNLYTSKTTDHTDDGRPDWNQAIQAWYDEVAIFNKALVNKFRTPPRTMIGHYTQLVWADTHLVGAGYIYYHELNSKWYTKLYTCNYGPTGNYVDRPLYIVGPACSKCPAGTKKDSKYNGLCTVDRGSHSCQII